MAASEPIATVPRGSSILGARLRESAWGYAFVALPMAVFGVFFLYPFGYAIYISLFKLSLIHI